MRTAWSRLALAAGVVLPIGVAAALVPLRTRVNNTNIALVLVAVVVAVAASGGRAAGVLASVSAALSFDFFHPRPFESHGRGRPMDRFILVPSPGVPVSWDRRVVAVAMADQVGAALAATSDGLGVS